MTPELLQELKKLCDEATPVEKWKDAGDWYHDCNVGMRVAPTQNQEEADCAFIAASRTALPELIAAYEEVLEANANCISRALHEARMLDVEQERDRLRKHKEKYKEHLKRALSRGLPDGISVDTEKLDAEIEAIE